MRLPLLLITIAQAQTLATQIAKLHNTLLEKTFPYTPQLLTSEQQQCYALVKNYSYDSLALLLGLRPEVRILLDNLHQWCLNFNDLPEQWIQLQQLRQRIVYHKNLYEPEKQLLRAIIQLLYHSYWFWKRRGFQKSALGVVMEADAFGLLKGILAGLLFFGLYDLNRMPTTVGIAGGIALAVLIPAIESAIVAIKKKKGQLQDYWIYP